MSNSFKAVWLGDSDPSSQLIRMGDLTFVKGEAVTIPGDHAEAIRIKDNPTFSTEGKAEPVPAKEPSDEEMAERLDEGTEKGAIKAELRSVGVEVKGNPSLETLRAKLVEATK